MSSNAPATPTPAPTPTPASVQCSSPTIAPALIAPVEPDSAGLPLPQPQPQPLPPPEIDEQPSNEPEKQQPTEGLPPQEHEQPPNPEPLPKGSQPVAQHRTTNLLDHLHPFSSSNTLVACSSQQILATALIPARSNQNTVTILFSVFPVPTRQTPQWLFTLPAPSLALNEPLQPPSHPTSPAAVDHLLFSPDGTHLLICSHTCSSLHQPPHLRLSMLIQDTSKADEWRLGWDELVCGSSRAHQKTHLSNLLEPQTKKVITARFLSDSRRWFTEPVTPELSVPEEETATIRSVKYRKPRRTQGSAINGFVQGKGQTAILVLNTNQLFVVHMPLPQTNLPPHVLLTTLSNSTLAATPLRLAPTPSSLAENKQQTVMDNSTRRNKPAESEAAPPAELAHKAQDTATQNLGLGFSLNASSFPAMNNASPLMEPNSAPAIQDALRGFGLNELLTAQEGTGRKEEGRGGASGYAFDPNGRSQFDEALHGFTQNRKEVRLAAIGLPCERQEAEEEEPHVLVAFQSTMRPLVPAPVRKTAGGATAEDGKAHVHVDEAHQMGGSQFSMAEDDVGDYITGLGDLDDAFDAPLDRTFSGSGNENSSDAGAKTMAKRMASEEGKMEEEMVGVGSGKRKGPAEGRMQKLKRRRYEPVVGIDESALAGGGVNEWTGYGFVEVAEVVVDFEESVVPTISIQHLPSLPIVDPFSHTEPCRVLLKMLNFLEPDLDVPSVSRAPQIRLLATYSRELGGKGEVVDEMQCWEARVEGAVLSSGFLGLECSGISGSTAGQGKSGSGSGGGNRQSVNNLDSLQGPEEWVISRASRKRLDYDNTGNTITKLSVCKVVPCWRPRSGSFLVFVRKEVRRSEDGEDRDEDQQVEVQCECLILNMTDLSEIGSRRLPVLGEREVRQLIVTVHGAWSCSVDERGRVRALALIGPEQKDLVVGLVISAIHNREPVDDISRLLSSKTTTCLSSNQSTEEDNKVEHEYIFAQISSFIASLTVSFKNYDLDPLLGCAWNVGYDLWSASPGYKEAAELALIGRQLCAALTIGISVKQEAYSRSLWQMIGYARWYARLCQRIISSAEPDSPTPHLCLLATTSCTFFYIFKFAMVINSFNQWLNIMHSANFVPGAGAPASVRPVDAKLSREIELAKGAFSAMWEIENPVQMEVWGKLLQELGPGVIPRPGTDLSKLPTRHTEAFSAPLAAVDPAQVAEAVAFLGRALGRQPNLVKPGRALVRSALADERAAFDVLTGIRLAVGGGGKVRECAKCRARAGEWAWRREASSMVRMAGVAGGKVGAGGEGHEGTEAEGPGPFECAVREYCRKCICAGVWVSADLESGGCRGDGGEEDGGSGRCGKRKKS